MTATTGEPNAELFVAVLAQIEAHPETWNQGVWRNTEAPCGTACCFAGWAATIDARTEWLVDERKTWDDHLYATPEEIASGDAFTLDVQRFRNVPLVDAASRAENALGIRNFQASRLFDVNNRLEDLYRISADILGIAPEALRDKVASVVADGATQ